jgi:hypothetical protein
MSTRCTIKIVDTDTGDAHRISIAHDGYPGVIVPILKLSISSSFDLTVQSVAETVIARAAAAIYPRGVPNELCIRQLTEVQSVDYHADYRYMVQLPSFDIISSADLA